MAGAASGLGASAQACTQINRSGEANVVGEIDTAIEAIAPT